MTNHLKTSWLKTIAIIDLGARLCRGGSSLLPTALAGVTHTQRGKMVLAAGWEFYQSYGMECLSSTSYGLLHRLFGLPHGLVADFQEQRCQKQPEISCCLLWLSLKSHNITSVGITSGPRFKRREYSSQLSTGGAIKPHIKSSTWDGRHSCGHFGKVQPAMPSVFIHSINIY